MDYYDILLGGNYDKNRMAEAARQLRRQEAYGTLGMMTGDPVMGAVGRGIVDRTGTRAGGLSEARESAEQRALDREKEARQAAQFQQTARPLGDGYYEQAGNIRQLPDWSERQERAHRRALEKARVAAEIRNQVAMDRMRATEDYKRTFIPEATWRGPKGVAQGLAQIEALGSLVDPMKAASDLSSPAADVAAEFLNDIGLGGVVRMTEPMYRSLDTRQLRSSLENILAKIRNSMFGAALTRYEGGRYEKVSPLAPGLEKDEIIRRTQNLADFLTKEANTLVAGRRSPSGAPMPEFLEQGWQWSGDGEEGEAQRVETPEGTVELGTVGTVGPPDDSWKLPKGWSVRKK